MFFRTRAAGRPFHLGTFPLELLPRDPGLKAVESARPRLPPPAVAATADASLSTIAAEYRAIYRPFLDAEPAPGLAPVGDDRERRAVDIKGFACFMDVSQTGICRLPHNAWLQGVDADAATHAIVLLHEIPPLPEADNPAHQWIAPAARDLTTLRATETAILLAGHIRWLGRHASVHSADQLLVDAGRLAVMAGLAVRTDEGLKNPYVVDYVLSVVLTDYALATDEPLHANALSARGLRYWWGQNGARSGRERRRRAARPSHLSRYLMEQVRRVARPTTLIFDDEVPRVPKRAAFFERALQGDLGNKAQTERGNFSFKHPTSRSLLSAIRALVPHQDGMVAAATGAETADPSANARAIKALSYHLGADLTGICEIPAYAWHSHRQDGSPIEPYHKYAIVMLIDQGYDTMEGASGDDWISGTQSMRGYLRGAEIAGVMGAHLRALGFPARAQTNADSDVLHIPLIMWAGLGELSRIGELVLNPFVGPRFKSVVLTTDMPLACDQPIDFGLQTFCSNCYKCVRECPCDAISWGNKVIFNGYEMWKPDVERCTKYRLTNARGSACGRCMKTCPLNKVVDTDGPLLTRVASWLGINAMWLKPVLVPLATRLDDWLGNGRRNLHKKWWFDLEIRDGVATRPRATNERELRPHHHVAAERQKIAYYHADQMPPPDQAGPYPLDRRAALAAAAKVETPAAALARRERGEAVPLHYIPTACRGDSDANATRVASVYDERES